MTLPIAVLCEQFDGDTLLRFQGLVREVIIAPHVQDYAIRLALATHPDGPTAPDTVKQYVRFGASPRGAQALVLAAKAAALLDGRPNVSAADVRSMAVPALRHRLVLGYEATAAGVTADHIVADVLATVPDPPAGLRGAP